MAVVWSLIAITISDALREPDQMFDISATIVHVSFLAIGTFVLSYDKIKWPPMRYGAINACIIMTFSLTQAYVRPGDKYHIIVGYHCSITLLHYLTYL
jgi:hypothetical protein